MILLNGKTYRPGRPFTTSDGTQYPANWYQVATPEQRVDVGFTEVPDPPKVDSKFYKLDAENNVIEQPLERVKSTVKSEISSIRYSKENEGIIYANSVFATDERSRVNYIGAVSQAQANSEFTVRWRKKDPETDEAGFITLDANSLIAVYGSGLHYITSCFYTEDYYHQQIEAAANVNTCIAIYESRETGWPSRNYGP